MKVVRSSKGLLQVLAASEPGCTATARALSTGLPALDALLPDGGFVCGAVHEVLSATTTPPFLFPVLIARAAAGNGLIAWLDVERELNPPSLAKMGISLDRLLVLRPRERAEQIWTLAECLRCKGVSACISPVVKLSRI